MSVTDHIATLIDQIGLATLGTDLFIDELPDSPTNAVVVYTTGGQAPTFVQDRASVETELPTFQLLVRAADPQTAKTRCHAIYDALIARGKNETINGVRFLRLVPLQTPYPYERDRNDNRRWGVNFIAEKEAG